MKHLVAVCLALAACSGEPPAPKPLVRITVVDDENTPVPGARIALGKRAMPPTDESGITQLVIDAREGDTLSATVTCPSGFDPIPTAQHPLVLRFIIPADGSDQPVHTETLLCVPRQKEHVLVVRTNVSRPIPVKMGDTLLGQTDADGVAQFVVRGEPKEDRQILLDTTAFPDLVPANPTRTLQLPQRRKFLFFEQKFDTKPKPRARKRRRPPRPHGPVRIR